MADIPSKFFDRFVLFGGVLSVFLALWVALNIHSGVKLEDVEFDIAGKFQEFKMYDDHYDLPSIKVANLSGEFVDVMDSDGDYIVLNIWATWCSACIKELPSLSGLSKTLSYDSGWRVIAVSIDSPDKVEKVFEFVTRYNVENVAGFHDYNLELQKNIVINKLPMTLILNNSGRVLYEIYGDAEWNRQEIVDFLNLVRRVR